MVGVSWNQAVGFLRSNGLHRRSLERNYTGLEISASHKCAASWLQGAGHGFFWYHDYHDFSGPILNWDSLKEGREELILLLLAADSL